MLTVYGIPNCDTCRKARKWFDEAGATCQFHDLRTDGVSAELLDRWLESVEWNSLLNTRSTTWRSLEETDKKDVDRESAKSLMLTHPTLIKRPVVEFGNTVIVGLSTDKYAELVD